MKAGIEYVKKIILPAAKCHIDRKNVGVFISLLEMEWICTIEQIGRKSHNYMVSYFFRKGRW